MAAVQTHVEHSVARVMIDAPPVNAVSKVIAEEITGAFEALSGRSDVNAVVLHGIGRGFSAGADLRAVPSDNPMDGAAERMAALRQCLQAIVDCPVPTIAALHGFAIGAGYFMAACCDITIAEDECEIGLPEIPLGMIGGYPFLRLNALPLAARYLYLTGRYIKGAEALSRGLVSDVAATGTVVEKAMAVAGSFAPLSRNALVDTKRTMNRFDRQKALDDYAEEHQALMRIYADGRHRPPSRPSRPASAPLSTPKDGSKTERIADG